MAFVGAQKPVLKSAIGPIRRRQRLVRAPRRSRSANGLYAMVATVTTEHRLLVAGNRAAGFGSFRELAGQCARGVAEAWKPSIRCFINGF